MGQAMKTQRLADEPQRHLNVPRIKRSPIVPGMEVLGGKYVVERKLGEGGMGVVVAARHKALGRLDAIKFLLPELVNQTEILARFEREAQYVAKLTSPHVARIYDSQFANTDEPYITMEYLEGRDLKLILRGGPLPIEDAVDYLLQVCHALTDAHEHGIVHRDLKPANLFLTTLKNGAPLIKVLDFGIAKDLDADPAMALTVDNGTGNFLGTMPYMSPEHLRGARHVDTRTDIWALGVIAYELLTGQRPFHAFTRFDLFSTITSLTEHPEPPSKYCRGLPLEIEMVIGRCLAKDRNARYPTVQHFAAALRFAAGMPALPPPMRPRIGSISTESPLDLLSAEETKTRALTLGKTHHGLTVTNPLPPRKPKQMKVALLGAGTLATLVAVVGLVMALRGRSDIATMTRVHTNIDAGVMRLLNPLPRIPEAESVPTYPQVGPTQTPKPTKTKGISIGRWLKKPSKSALPPLGAKTSSADAPTSRRPDVSQEPPPKPLETAPSTAPPLPDIRSPFKEEEVEKPKRADSGPKIFTDHPGK